MSRVFRTKTFTRWMRKAGLADDALCEAVSEMISGLIDADLGGHIVKKRIAIAGQGKRGGARTIVASKLADRWFFIYGFAKNEKDNIDKDELNALQGYARLLLWLGEIQLEEASFKGEIVEICNDKT